MSDVPQASIDGEPWWRLHSDTTIAGVPLRSAAIKGLIALVVAAGLGYGLLHTKLFALEQIEITGAEHLDRQGVLTAAGIKEREFLIRIDEASAARRIERQPWVADAVVERRWPHRVEIAVRERIPVAIAQVSEGKWALIGDDGIVLETGDAPRPGLPNVLDVVAPAQAGAKLDPKVSNLLDVAEIMPESLRGRVVQLQERPDGIRLGLDAGTIVELGDERDLGAKLMSAATVLSNSDASKIAVLDVRSPESPLSTPINTQRNAPSTSTSTTKSTTSSASNTTVKPSTSTAGRKSTSTSMPSASLQQQGN